MVSSSKILTVSYGTFSCTAEGFEDPLAVVKETTQFFRGVVGEDRFFGAEPPQFDADLATEMMRERLGAEAEEGRLTLGPPPVSVTTAAASAGALAAALAAGPSRSETAQPAGFASDLPDDDTIEATAVVTERLAPAEAEAAAAAFDDIALDVARDPDAQDASNESDPWDITLDAGTAPTEDAPLHSAAETALAASAALEDIAPAPRSSSPDSVAAKLDRIRAVVSGNAAEVGTEAATETPTGPTGDIADEAPMAEPATAVIGPQSGEEVDDDALDALLGALDNEVDEDPDTSTVVDVPPLEGFNDVNPLADTVDELLGDTPAATGTDTPDFADTIASLLGDTKTADDVDDSADTSGNAGLNTALAAGGLAAAASALSAFTGKGAAADTPIHSDPAEANTESDSVDFNLFAEDDSNAVATDYALEDSEAPVSDPDLDAALAALVKDSEATPPLPTPVATIAETKAPAPRARVVKVKRADFLKAVQDGQIEEIADPDEAPEEDSAFLPDLPEVPPAPAPALAPDLQDLEPASAAPQPEMSPDSGLSQEEEDELARELAAVKAELSSDLDAWSDAEAGTDPEPAPLRLDNPVAVPLNEDDDEDADWPADFEAADARASEALTQPKAEDGGTEELIRDTARKTVKMASPARALLTEQEVEEGDTSRLMDQTDSAMDEPEGNRRRTAIAHLRAAVAATKADRLLGRKSDATEEQEPYREDLANVVRPRRPQSSSARTDRPAESPPVRSAPLKLVAEQRVGDPAETDAQARVAEDPTAQSALPRTAPVRPRRVRRVTEEEQDRSEVDGDSGFVAYAQGVGATDLPELLEAAAAYMSYVEGRDQFSRPQLMSTVRQAEAEESSREDRLRSFGQLLREGKIKKTTGGRFTASERISFKPDRAAV